MSLKNRPEYAGPPSAVYIGTYPASGNSSLIKMQASRQEGVMILETTPQTYVVSKGTYVQAGPHSVEVNVTFLGEDDLAYKISRGIPITGNINDTPDPGNRYCLLLIYAKKNQKKSY